MNRIGLSDHVNKAAFLLEALRGSVFSPFAIYILWLMTTSFIFKTMDMPVFPFSVCLFFHICSPGWFETCYIVQAALQVLLLLSLPVRFWDHKYTPPRLVPVELLCIEPCHLQTVFNILSSFLLGLLVLHWIELVEWAWLSCSSG